MKEINRPARAGDIFPGDWSESLFLSLMLTGRVLRMAFDNFVGSAMSRMRLLAIVYTHGELSQADLQRELAVDGATITRQVKRLEVNGLLLRRADPKDNRFTLVELTQEGEAMVEALAQRGVELERLAIHDIAPEQLAVATAVLSQMRCNLQALTGGKHCSEARATDVQG